MKRKIKKWKSNQCRQVHVPNLQCPALLLWLDDIWHEFDNDTIHLHSCPYIHYPSCHLLSPPKLFCRRKVEMFKMSVFIKPRVFVAFNFSLTHKINHAFKISIERLLFSVVKFHRTFSIVILSRTFVRS